MNTVAPILRILPEVVLTITGILIMLAEPMLAPKASRKPLGWLAVAGTLVALGASHYQCKLAPGTAFFNTIQTDAFSSFFHVTIAGIVLVSLLVALDSTNEHTPFLGEYFALVVFGAVGMMLMTSASELLVVFIGLEISSISTYILAGFRRKSAKAPESSIKYFLLGSFATAFFLYGIALTFGATGTTTISGIAQGLTTSQTPALALVGSAMILIGLGFKVSAAPFQVWTPDVYEGAPSPVVGLMSTAPKAAAFAVLLRVLYGAFPALHANWVPLIWIIAALSMTIGNLGALRQVNVKRMLAYSSIAHAGYLLVAFTALSADGIAAASFYALSYAAMNVGIFAVVSHAGGYEDRLTEIEDYRGLAYRSPLLGGAMGFFLISLIGIPFTGGFFGKFYVFSAAIHSGFVWLAVIGLLNSGIAAYYYLRVLATVYNRPYAAVTAPPLPRAKVSLLIALFLTVATTLILGIAPGRILSQAKAGALTLLPTQTTEAPSQGQ
ncbi:NADH-quinone oxidoreductase subunit N [Silvibacterium dinghuense]|uniref:NADH-quinone oxidoreductase subunit N n=1 Tax=Silvibacterium dinghuense TaxID=1560006 RepID=A0A4Q1SD63_9BACT|nr:NADH-quinone oxidoreductase subunit N [Silvibacterium dinghuense]RXS95169.1 NADH-quinone oxidoreductase subunit N [Silvibacterium dinghuense]GGH11257.1 NADH-quinone oxidoreductase subunit N [Silvibacterium dinghuense]